MARRKKENRTPQFVEGGDDDMIGVTAVRVGGETGKYE